MTQVSCQLSYLPAMRPVSRLGTQGLGTLRCVPRHISPELACHQGALISPQPRRTPLYADARAREPETDAGNGPLASQTRGLREDLKSEPGSGLVSLPIPTAAALRAWRREGTHRCSLRPHTQPSEDSTPRMPGGKGAATGEVMGAFGGPHPCAGWAPGYHRPTRVKLRPAAPTTKVSS